MPTKDQVWMAADRILERGDAVSQASVITELRTVWGRQELNSRGGSPKTVGPPLRDWKVARSYRPRAQQVTLPNSLLDPLRDFAGAVWEAALIEAQARLEDERRKAEATVRANDELRVESSIIAEAAIGEAETQKVRNAALELANTQLRAEVERLRERLNHLRSEEYWDRVMEEVYELLPSGGTMAPADILRALRRSTMRSGRHVREPLDEATLRKKLDVRVSWERYFERLGHDAYGRLPGWCGVLGIRERRAAKAK